MIMREGMLPVRMIKEQFPNVVILANAKLVDGGVNMKTIPIAKVIGPEIVVAGGALTKALDLRTAQLKWKRQLINNFSGLN